MRYLTIAAISILLMSCKNVNIYNIHDEATAFSALGCYYVASANGNTYNCKVTSYTANCGVRLLNCDKDSKEIICATNVVHVCPNIK